MVSRSAWRIWDAFDLPGLNVAFVGTTLLSTASIRAAGGVTFMTDLLPPASGMGQSIAAAMVSCAREGSPAVPGWGVDDLDTCRWQALAGASQVSRLFQELETAAGPAADPFGGWCRRPVALRGSQRTQVGSSGRRDTD